MDYPSEAEFDIIIAGAGAAGLSLLWHLLHSEKQEIREKSVLVVDKSLTPSNDKTWCFWDDHSMPFGDLIYHSWNTLEVTAHGHSYSEELSKFRYHCIRSVDYASDILKLASEQENVSLLETDIIDFTCSGNRSEIKTSAGNFSASYIFQSALKPPGFDRARVDLSLMQHFLGWEIEADLDLFDPDKATLMDFDLSREHGVTFMYILPFSSKSALIEHTLFTSALLTDDQYESEIRAYLKEKYSLSHSDYRIIRKEKGIIPMEDRRYSAEWCAGVYNIGTRGGLTKPSTGYTFTRIHRQSKEIVRALEEDRTPAVRGNSPYRFRVYDIMLLYLLENHAETSVTIFRDLFKRNSFDRILVFLEEKTTLAQEVKIFSSLPYIPFFRAIWKMKHRILTGA